jgi:hypothetical protein
MARRVRAAFVGSFVVTLCSEQRRFDRTNQIARARAGQPLWRGDNHSIGAGSKVRL